MRTPREPRGLAAVRREVPDGWEHLLYAGALVIGRQRHAVTYRDHLLRHGKPSGPQLDEAEALHRLEAAFADLSGILEGILHLFDPAVHEHAFGPPGRPGDATFIEHVAERTIEGYRMLLDWGRELRSTRVPLAFRELYGLTADIGRQPVEDVRDFVDHVVEVVEYELSGLDEGRSPQQVEVTLILTVDDELVATCGQLLAGQRARLGMVPGTVDPFSSSPSPTGQGTGEATVPPGRPGGGFLSGAVVGGALAHWFHDRSTLEEETAATADNEFPDSEGAEFDWFG